MASRRIRVKWRYDGALRTSRARARTTQAAAQVPCAPKQRKFSEALLRPPVWLTPSPSKREWQASFGQNSFGSENDAAPHAHQRMRLLDQPYVRHIKPCRRCPQGQVLATTL